MVGTNNYSTCIFALITDLMMILIITNENLCLFLWQNKLKQSTLTTKIVQIIWDSIDYICCVHMEYIRHTRCPLWGVMACARCEKSDLNLTLTVTVTWLKSRYLICYKLHVLMHGCPDDHAFLIVTCWADFGSIKHINMYCI